MKLFCVLFACTFALATVACGGGDDSGSGGDGDGDTEVDAETGCVRMCEKANACPDAVEQDCEGQCALITAAAEVAGCETEWGDLVDCARDHDDVACDEESDVCDTETEDFETCINALEGS